MDKEHFKKIKNLAENQEALKYFNTTYKIDPKNLGIKNYKEYEDKLEETIKRYRARKEYENKLEETIKRYRTREFKLTKKNYLIIALSAIAIALVVGLYPFLLIGFGVIDITGLSGPNQIKSGFFTDNLEGDAMGYWAAWLLVRDVLDVNIQNANEYPEKIPLIENVIMSKDKITKSTLFDNDLVYYKGWVGALESIHVENTERQVPKKFSIIESGKGEGDITITLSNLKNNDGLLGTTKLITDVNRNQILKAHITIYEVNTLSDEKFETIFRHEFGHAIGLAHSTAVEDLMHPTVKSDFPYISECNIDALVSLYDESDPSQVICKN